MDVIRHGLTAAAQRLGERGLFQAGSTLSQRIAGTDQVALLDAESAVLRFASVKSAEQGDQAILDAHLQVYRLRADAGAVLINHQPWALALHELGQDMPGIFDEQVRHLGRRVARVGARALLDGAALRGGVNALVLPGQVVCIGMTLDRAVFNAELLEKCATAFALASASGQPVGTIPWLVRYIANGRLRKDQRFAASEYAAGRVPHFKSAY